MSDNLAFTKADTFSVAPMIDVTTSAFRRMCRIMSKRAMLYTEMVAAEAILHGKLNLLSHDEKEIPCVLQLGGSDPERLAMAAKIGEEQGYSAINLNAGCPSDKVQSGEFGAVLMKNPQLIADAYQKMQNAVKIPVTIKTRIGVDDLDDFDYTVKIVKTIYDAGCRHIVLHARKAWLNGLSPKENRTIPPLDYERVYQIKELFCDLAITINGGIITLDDCLSHLTKVNGVMLGRAVIDNPYLLSSVDRVIYKEDVQDKSRKQVLDEIVDLCENFLSEGHKFHHLAQHALNLFAGCKGSRRYRQYLSATMHKKDAKPELLLEAYKLMQDVV